MQQATKVMQLDNVDLLIDNYRAELQASSQLAGVAYSALQLSDILM